ncbi:MAG: Gfo/Idh/MocA family oxidoreductase [Chloroflexi bacterium]|nr:Gfo/Idh/MocA family oxidoreductase [Chloroflexota bacterium]
MPELRFALFGAGFWSQFQLAGWQELEGARCAAIYNRTLARGQALAERFGVPAVYDDPERLLDAEAPDFIDIVTGVESHAPLVRLAAARGIPVICQKPMATSLQEAEEMVATCRAAGVPLYIHENWRWQPPLRALHRALGEGRIGRPFRARIQYNSSAPVFDNQPFLKDLEQFIVADMGSHILDAARFLFGEAESVYCRTQRVHRDIRGEDVATIVLGMASGMTVTCEISYASRLEGERFPETFVTIEGEEGSLVLAPDYWLRETTAAGTLARRCPPPHYPWADPAYDVVHSSIVGCNASLLDALAGRGDAETTGEDNLRTVRLVYAAYESAAANRLVRLHPDEAH